MIDGKFKERQTDKKNRRIGDKDKEKRSDRQRGRNGFNVFYVT